MTDKRVLVADDSEAIREMLGSFLANLGYHTDLASRWTGRYQPLQSAPLRCRHLRSADAPMSKGLDVLAQVKALDPDVQVIILTGHATLETAIEALRLGAYEYQFKPVEDMEIFARLVERAYHHRRLLRENKRLLAQLQEANAHLESEVDETHARAAAANESLRNLDRLKNDFVSIVSHELRTPLAVITLEAQMLASGMQFSPEKLQRDSSGAAGQCAAPANPDRRSAGLRLDRAGRVGVEVHGLLDQSDRAGCRRSLQRPRCRETPQDDAQPAAHGAAVRGGRRSAFAQRLDASGG